MDARIYLISASYVSQSRFRALAGGLVAAAPCTADAVRLEASGGGLWQALDNMAAQGAARIELRPVGLPFSQSLEAWLPGAVGAWLARQDGARPEILLAAAPQADETVLHRVARAQVDLTPVRPQPDGELGKGWDSPPGHRHHLLVCTGPRCHLKDAPSLLEALKAELGRARIAAQCLVTSTGCLFPCNSGPVVVHYPKGNWYRVRDLAEVRRLVADALCAGTAPDDLLIRQSGETHEFA